MIKLKKIVLSFLGGMFLELSVLLFLSNSFNKYFEIAGVKAGELAGNGNQLLLVLFMILIFIVVLIPFIGGFIISYKFSGKELEKIEKYHNNFIITIIRIILAIIFLLLFFESNIIAGLINVILILSVLPLTYRVIKDKLNITVPKWVQIILPIVLLFVEGNFL